MLQDQPIDLEYNELLRTSWRIHSKLLADPNIGDWLLRCATPILAFGHWQTARIATAALNPSEREFLDERGQELGRASRRFLHRTPNDVNSPSDSMLEQARQLAKGYFELGNAYWLWFRGFQPLLDELGFTFASGGACHTDYLTPFATVKGLGSVPATVRKALQSEGTAIWRATLDIMPELRLVFGIGSGWWVMPSVFGFDEWETVSTSFDSKGGKASVSKPYLLHKPIRLQGRSIDLFWWRPNRGEPLTWLNEDDKRLLAAILKARMTVLPLS